jgi:molybdate transport system permease protein
VIATIQVCFQAISRYPFGVDLRALVLSLKLALLVSTALLVLGMPLAYWLAFSHRRWKFLVEAVVALPLVLPPTVLGFYLLVALGPQSPLGRWWQSWTGHTLAFTFEGLVIGSILYSLPFAAQPFAASFAAIDRRLLAASSSLGASPLRTFLRVTLPLATPGIITGCVLAFAHTLGEFGVVLMIGGNIPGATKTISIAIYDDVQSLDYAAANHAAVLLLVLSFVTLCLVYGLNRRSSQLGPVGDSR